MPSFNLYPRNASAELARDVFRHPTAEYRGTPFWAWNCKLDRAQLLRQIEVFKEMGLGGFHMHSRVGMATAYLGPEFMAQVQACTEKAREMGMLSWLYDEDRWPSGFAGGLVTRDPAHRVKHLLFTPSRPAGAEAPAQERPVARYLVRLEKGVLAQYRRLRDGDAPAFAGAVWHAYLKSPDPSPWYNGQTYVDTLSRAAIERFVAVTHERYAQAVGKHFGTTVPAIFCDEPLLGRWSELACPTDLKDVMLPWTTDFAETYRAAHGEDLLDFLPELVWELPGGKVSRARYRYANHVTERFASAFADTVGGWCERHGIALTGHLMAEDTLNSQTHHVGEAMRSYRGFQLPGIDLLCDHFQFNTAKQAQSAARQFRRPGVLSELYGVTNWDFDFAGHKRQGDWQAALGITVRVQHLAWVSMEGEAKRDYPASISYQSPWYKEYPLVEDHFARLNTALTRGRAVTRVAVVHPIESFWLYCGPWEQTRLEREDRDAAFKNLTDWLLHGLLDFDFLSESLLPQLGPAAPGPRFQAGACAYDVVVVPHLRTIRATTLDRLEAFASTGGTVIFAGAVPDLVDAVPSARARDFAARCTVVPLTRSAVLEELEPWREVAVHGGAGGAVPELLYQLREDGPGRWLFICNTSLTQGHEGCRVAVPGRWQVTEWDTFTGETRARAAETQDGQTVFVQDLPAGGHVLVRLERVASTPAAPAPAAAAVVSTPPGTWRETFRFDGPVPVTLSEPNVLLLDQAEFRLDDGAWESREELLRTDTLLRSRLKWPLTGGGMAQPWTEPDAPPDHRVSLRFRLECGVAVPAPKLAVEHAANCALELDGRPVPVRVDGWWVDEAIKTVPLPALAPGLHTLVVTQPYGRRISLEWCYLLGDFGVEVCGRSARIVAPVRELCFGDWTRQGLPFYAGNVTYHCTLPASTAAQALHVPRFRAPLLAVALEGRRAGSIAFPPYRLDLAPAAAPRRLDLTAYGNRINAFGALHNCDTSWPYWGPSSWRTDGEKWSYEYVLRPMGVLAAPRVLERRTS